MTWEARYGLKTWQFICLDDNRLPIARVNVNVWALQTLASIEFLDTRVDDMCQEMREEIIVTGATLYLCIWYRMSNPLPLIGAVFSPVGPIKQ